MIVVLSRALRSTNKTDHAADQNRLGVIEANKTDTSWHDRKQRPWKGFGKSPPQGVAMLFGLAL
jgi:hypothetical protein